MTNAAARRRAFYEASRPLAEAFAFKPGDEPPLRSRSRDHEYRMLVLPEGLVVHQDEGCEGEPYNGPLACWHSQQIERYVMTSQAVTRYEGAMSPVAIDFNKEQLDVIKTTIAKGATDTELQLFVATCRRTGLDPFLKQIYAIKRWDSRERKETMGIQVGIDGLRLIAERTGKFAGMDPVEWLDVDGVWSEVWTGSGEHPIAARTAVYRKDFERKVPAVARWDSYAQSFGNPPKLSVMWDKMPDVMIGKCAESLALRRAFPAEMSGLAAAIDSEYDPAIEVDELRGADPGNEHEGAIEGEVVPPAPITDATLQRLNRLWGRANEAQRAEVRRQFPKAYPKEGQGANSPRSLSEADALTACGLLEAKPETPATATSAQENGAGTAGPTSPACQHEDAIIDPQTTLMTCPRCGPIEGPSASTDQPAQAAQAAMPMA